MAEAFLADVAATAVSNLLSAVSDPLIRVWGLKGDLSNLRRKVRLAQALLSDAMRTTSTVTSSVAGQIWMEELADVVHDAENLLAELDYRLLRQKIKRHNKVCAKLASTLSAMGLSQKIQKISASFDRVHSEGLGIGLKPLEQLPANPAINIPQKPPTVDESEIVGREGDVSLLVQRICCCASSSSSSSINDLSFLTIVGSGGLGKTTLAQLVFKNEQIVKHFGERIWVSVSDQFDTLRILNDMLQSLTQQNHALTTMEALIKKLKQSLGDKRFLLVLDDVWNKRFGVWDTLRSSLKGMNCIGDNTILITTRDREVAFNTRSCFTHPLLTLSEADSWTLFRQKAFGEGGAKETEALRAIGERLVRRCGGVPLALRVLGGIMYSRKSESEWLSIENNPRWSTEAEVMPCLRVSFDHLNSSALKCCFAFCSIFPKDFALGKDMLAQCWMALGFLDDFEGGGDMEDKAEVYFNRLVWSSLFHMLKGRKDTTTCEMHDLVHDLAIDVSKKYCASQGGSAAANSIHKAIHVSLIYRTRDELEFSRLNLNRLQTLYLDHDRFAGDKDKSLAGNEILGKFKHLRILVLRDWNLQELPCSIGDLKELRFLDISSTGISRLPDSITNLYLLQTVRVLSLEELPKRFGNLISLRYFCATEYQRCKNCLFVGVGRATGLRTLPCFAVNETKGCRLAELGSLDKLSGELSIYMLQNVSGMEAAKKANLCTKPNIHVLRYHWDRWTHTMTKPDYNNNEAVLEGLRPHSNLKELEIEYFSGRSLASWMMRVEESSKVLQNLVKITLRGCHFCQEIPSLGHLPHLEFVWINGLGSLKRIGSEFYGEGNNSSSAGESTCTSTTTRVLFPSLKQLSLDSTIELEEWSEAEGVGYEAFPRLEELEIIKCFKLESLPGHFPSLQKLKVCWVKDMTALEKMSRNLTTLNHLHLDSRKNFRETNGQTVCAREAQPDEWAVAKLLLGKNAASLRVLHLQGFRIVGDDNDALTLQSLTSLTLLNIRGSDQLTKFPIDCLQCSTSLEELRIVSCPRLSLPDVGHLTKLRVLEMGGFSPDLDEFPWLDSHPTSCSSLTLYGWEKLKTLPHQIQHLAASLTHLTISSFGGLESLPERLGNLSNLETLTLSNCRNLKSMPSVEAMQRLHRLNLLSVNNCPLGERCREGSGPEWPKIAHIPRVSIFPFTEIHRDSRN